MLVHAGKAKEAPSCWWRKWLYTQIGALTPTYFGADAHDDDDDDDAYILKAKKFAEPLFQSKKIAEKVRKSGRHFWAIWGNFGPFWVIFGPFWIILGHSRVILGHFRPFWVIFGPLWAI